jgi:dihydrofolate synthase/folylpolyglutamate synthase
MGGGEQFNTLDQWLGYIEGVHSQTISLGLDRVQSVRERLAASTTATLITVGGTNGKGSSCAMLEAILIAAGYRVGVYSSPHLLRYNERVRIGRQDVADELLCQGFAQVEAARGITPLTYFEFGTLAAWWVFCHQSLDVIILEVGLGGRLDAVNIFEPDCAVVTGVAMDHMDYLGDTREKIGFEKAGIFRTNTPAVCGDPDPPASLLAHARSIGAKLLVQGRDYGFSGTQQQWKFTGPQGSRNSLAFPALRGANQLLNASTVLAALGTLEARIPVSMQAIREGLMLVELPGRFQVLAGRPSIVLDVAHNPQAAAVLADNLSNMGFFPDTWAICGMLSDKDIEGSIRAMLPRVDHWLLCDLPGPRGAQASDLAAVLEGLGCTSDCAQFSDPATALSSAQTRCGENDRIVVFGSFLTVADVSRALTHSR